MITIVSRANNVFELNASIIAMCAKRPYHSCGFIAKSLTERALFHVLALAAGAPNADIQATLRQGSIKGAHEPAAALVESCELWPVPPVMSTEMNQYD